ncbi:hypothetical protein FH972_015445 [Carpinus fangiana]|uniref:Myb/SANT-like domain-containing protein n=1 Tax=Carpinus fangiana TaxID=176857 RepID=A0A5N6RG62_9ROSI|nr:hypothetical protein FH972_015445 [Carpinus fangiana]
MDWTPLEQKILIEFAIMRSKGDKGILKQDPTWVKILRDVGPSITSEKRNVAVLKEKWRELKRSCKAITQMVEYDGYKINKIVDGIDAVEGERPGPGRGTDSASASPAAAQGPWWRG